jgi:hypothetical protein
MARGRISAAVGPGMIFLASGLVDSNDPWVAEPRENKYVVGVAPFRAPGFGGVD